MRSRSQVDRGPARCSGGSRFDSCQGLRFFLCPVVPRSLISSLFTMISLPSFKFTIFIHLPTFVLLQEKLKFKGNLEPYEKAKKYHTC